jgi:hypothetical protein
MGWILVNFLNKKANFVSKVGFLNFGGVPKIISIFA